MAGPLTGVKILEFAGIGPGPFCAMLLSDLGAEIVRIDRKGAKGGSKFDVTSRGRRSIAIDLKNPKGVETVLALVAQADAILEGFRPGVMERLGLGPEVCLERNPRLVYGRMTGWGQHGPLAHAAGHDINYIALTGALHAMGRTDTPPPPPLNLVGDFGGGALYLAFGLVAGLFEAQRSGQGQVIDAAMTDGAASLMAMFYGMKAGGLWQDKRDANLLDGGAHFYDTYECGCGKFVAVGSIEPQFYALLLEKAGINDPAFQHQMDRMQWSDLSQKLATLFRSKTRDEWCALMEGTDICFAPVLSLEEAPAHPHNAARQTFIEVDGVVQPNAAPRFSRTKEAVQGPAPTIGEHSESALIDWGFSAADVAALRSDGVI
ncbi:MAG: CaiB/BaiF CoA transferase family protein [Alphaproteobacteria bacterium]